MRFLLTLVFCFNILFGYYYKNDIHEYDLSVLRNLDINESFIEDKILIQMKQDLSLTKNTSFTTMIENGKIYLPLLGEIIYNANVPNEMLFLAIAESHLKAKATSSSKAAGLWQFISPTAKIFGLEINEYIDERLDPVKSTKIAINYLRYLHSSFDKWYLAILAYNVGEGALRRAIKKAGSDELEILLDEEKKYLPRETRNHIRKVLVIAHVFAKTKFAQNYEIHENPFVSVQVPGGTTLMDVKEATNTNLSTLKNYNPQLKYVFVPPTNSHYKIHIPKNKLASFKKNFKATKNNNYFLAYKVKSGDNLSQIADMYNVKIKIIKDYNKLSSNFLKINQKLIIPVPKDEIRKYTIKSGDTIAKISKSFKVSIETIKKANKLSSALIKPGDEIVIPLYKISSSI